MGNEKGLENLAELVNNGATGINITLTNDIDLTGIDWTPIGNDTNHIPIPSTTTTRPSQAED